MTLAEPRCRPEVVRDLLSAGARVADAARACGVSRAMIYKVARRCGLELPPVAPPRATPDLVRDLLGAGGRVADAARALGVNRATIYKLARRCELQLPARSSRTPDREGWLRLIEQHGLSLRQLGKATGLRGDYVAEQLERHGIIEVHEPRRSYRRGHDNHLRQQRERDGRFALGRELRLAEDG